jgi:CRP-like cAMP-binding protein
MLTDREKARLLRIVPFFSALPDEVLTDLAPRAREVLIPAGEAVFQKGEAGDRMFLIVQGEARVHDGEHQMNYLRRGDIFGETAALDGLPRVATVTAVYDLTLLELDQTALFALMRESIAAMVGIVRGLTRWARPMVHQSSTDFHYIQAMTRLTAAAAQVEAGVYEPEGLDRVAARPDDLGQLARLFQRMIREVYTREQALQRQVAELRIEIDQAHQAHQVAQIVGTGYFQALRDQARDLRQMLGGAEASLPGRLPGAGPPDNALFPPSQEP